MRKLRAAIIGLGHQAAEDHIPGILESQFAELVAICDNDKEKLNKWKNELNVNTYTDYRDLLNSEKLDFIIAATPHNIYKGIIEEAAKKGIHILKEKPFAISLKEACYLKDVCDKHKIHLMTTLQRRFNPIYTTFFQLVDKIGEPYFIDARYTLFIDKPADGWRGDIMRAGGGCIIDMGYHMLDMLIWYFGLPDKVHAEFTKKSGHEEDTCNVENTAVVLFRYNNGLKGTLTLSRCYPPKTEVIRILGTRGIIEVRRGSIVRLRTNGEVAESLSREYSWPVAASNQIDHFCNILNKGKENVGSPKYHLQHASFIEACYKSKKEDRYINPKDLLNCSIKDFKSEIEKEDK